MQNAAHLSRQLLRTLSSAILAIGLIVSLNVIAHAQLSGDQPLSWRYDLKKVQRVDSLSDVNIDSVLAEDERHKSEFQLFRIGAALPFNVDMLKIGQWDTIPKVGRVCRLALHVPGAVATCLNYSAFRLPKGSLFFVYNPIDTTELRGAFGEIDNKEDNQFATGFIRGQDVTLEYFEPLGEESGSISVGSVVHTFRRMEKQVKTDGRGEFDALLSFGDAKPCNIDIKCSQGLPYANIARSVVMIVVDSQTRAASGALINNVRLDKKPYILTAGHVYATDPAISRWLM